MNVPDGPTLRVLLSDVDWLRALAGVLVHEVDLADDAAADAPTAIALLD